jgi:hypothetical protein
MGSDRYCDPNRVSAPELIAPVNPPEPAKEEAR